MDDDVKEVQDESEIEGSEETDPKSRLDLLRQIESGQINVDEALQRLQADHETEREMDVLEQLEEGQIDVEEALHRLEISKAETSSAQPDPSVKTPISDRKWRDWWLVILASGLAILALGGWLGTIGGWWWVFGGPLLLLGLILFVVALASRNAPWLHLRVDTGQQSWPRHIALSLPLPIKLASWGLRMWGPRIPNLDETAIDDLILALEGNISKDTPLHIEVQEDETTGERVEIFLG
jgi:hypothetical protein